MVLATLALSCAGLGAYQMHNLSRGFELHEIQRPADLQSFRSFLAGLDTSTPLSNEDSVSRLAIRLLNLPLPQRRRSLQAMSQASFWSGLSADFRRWSQLQAIGLLAVEKAVLEMPVAGDMWLAVARLRVNVSGFDARAAEALRLSYVYAPREADLAIGRLDLAVSNNSLFDDLLRQKAGEDLAMLKETFPAKAEELVKRLADAGFRLD